MGGKESKTAAAKGATGGTLSKKGAPASGSRVQDSTFDTTGADSVSAPEPKGRKVLPSAPVLPAVGAAPSGPRKVGSVAVEEKKPELVISTFRAKKDVPSGTKKERLSDNLQKTMDIRREKVRVGLDGEPLLKELIRLPEGEDVNDWLGVNTIHFFNIASMVYGTVLEYCTEDTCPTMTAGAKYQYYWADGGTEGVEPKAVPAREYMSKLFDWIEEQIANPKIFPTDDETPYPSNYKDVVRNIFKRLFRMYGHVYYSHFDKVRSLGAESHLNSSFQHFAYFVIEYDLVPEEELRPLRKLIGKLVPGFL